MGTNIPKVPPINQIKSNDKISIIFEWNAFELGVK
jgi:hypothetical protein